MPKSFGINISSAYLTLEQLYIRQFSSSPLDSSLSPKSFRINNLQPDCDILAELESSRSPKSFAINTFDSKPVDCVLADIDKVLAELESHAVDTKALKSLWN
jgi:hypothetical protein